MPVDLKRTFSVAGDKAEDRDDWSQYLGRESDKLTWKGLHEKSVTVVVGEAGIGKTIEFRNEVQRLRRSGKVAFFIELNQLIDRGSWELALEHSELTYTRWKSSSEFGYFFLDAVDEARLNGHEAFKKALTVVCAGLRQDLHRVRIAISSRWTDWSIDEVRTTVHELLVAAIESACRAIRAVSEVEFGEGTITGQVTQAPSEVPAEAFVVELDNLSRSEACTLTDALGIVDAPAFWVAIDDGHYDYMATRPLDLIWMVGLWNQRRSLGTYLEFIDGNVANRLTETNASYQASGAVLSRDRLRMGAEQLSAASEFSGRAFVATVSTLAPRDNEVMPLTVLTDWTPSEVTLLLASAVFDEATFGRVKFTHRSLREYLAACWANRQLATGLPLHRVLPLFSASPFGEMVLIQERRATLCWLAALNVKVQEWVTRHFPEMLLFGGDPEAWDALSAEKALLGYVQRLEFGLRTDWYNNASEFRRVGMRVPSGRIASILADPKWPARVKTALLPIVKHARLSDCADVVFGVLKSGAVSLRERRYALDVLETIATPEQREAIRTDLLSGALTSNELIASALAAADWKNFTVDEFAKVFAITGSEGGYGSGPMARAIKDDLLPVANADLAVRLLEAVVAVLPRQEEKQFARYPESDQPEHAWLLDVLPDCVERLLTLLPTTLEDYPAVGMDAAKCIEALRHTWFTDRDEFSRLHGLIAKHTKLRWQLGLAIAQSEDITHSTGRLTWGIGCIVSFDVADMPALIARANDAGLSPGERGVWFAVAKEIAIRGLRGKARTKALATLETGPEAEARTKTIVEQRARFIESAKQRRSWNAEERKRKHEQVSRHEANTAMLRTDIQHIRDATNRRALNWLVHYSYEHSGRHSLTHVDYGVIAKAFGQEIGDALAAGLKVVWATAGAPNPADYSDGALPWDALTALAGLHTLLAEHQDIAALKAEEAARAARLAVWELNEPPSWFARLATSHCLAVCETLHPWICSEALSMTDASRIRGALEMALRCSTEVRSMLLRPLVPMVMEGRVARPERVNAVVDALREDGLMSSTDIGVLCLAKISESIGTDGLIGDIRWLRIWLEGDVNSAWEWFERHVDGIGHSAGSQVKNFAKAMRDCKWVKMPANDVTVAVLLRLHALLSKHLPLPDAPVEEGDDGVFGHPIAQLREAIPGVLVQVRGIAAHRALVQLVSGEANQHARSWLESRVYEHAALEASQSAQIEPSDLCAIGSPFLTEPQSEAQLYLQVVARLEEIKKSIEEGPFSDRVLFAEGMAEKKLQLWLAARFHDTSNRRFGVHREEDVDADNHPDIQLSCRHWNVCIELKPVDTGRYSANSLTETLRTQIVGQYLRGNNSSHGILVLFRLDEKAWDIPEGERGQPFSALVSYLQGQARAIKAESTGVQELIVFAIDCVAPKTA